MTGGVQIISLDEVIARRNGSVDPAKFPCEYFELLSIPAFDVGKPEITLGAEIGSTKQLVQAGDVLLSKIVPHIRRAWVVKPTTNHRLIASGEWIVFRDSRFDPNYLRHLLTADGFHRKFMQTVSGIGGSLLRARPAEVAKIKVPLPPITEQQRIATILDKADSLRRKRQEAIRLADEFLRAVFFERFSAKPRSRVLTDYCDFLAGFAFKSDQYIEPRDGVRLLRGINVGIDRFEWGDTAGYPLNAVGDLARYRLKESDVVLAMDRPWISTGLKCAVVDDRVAGCYLVQRVARLRPKLQGTSAFIMNCLQGNDFKSHCRITETTIPHISPKDFSTFPVPAATEAELRSFADIATRIQRVVSKAEQAAMSSDELKSSLQATIFNMHGH
jgi:type I restriction enzyme S subunit